MCAVNYGRHDVQRRRRRRRRRHHTYAPTSNTASHFCHEKSDSRVSVSMGLRLADLRALEAPLKFQIWSSKKLCNNNNVNFDVTELLCSPRSVPVAPNFRNRWKKCQKKNWKFVWSVFTRLRRRKNLNRPRAKIPLSCRGRPWFYLGLFLADEDERINAI